jgi:enoyl-CoA hydratase/carnithine racemase
VPQFALLSQARTLAERVARYPSDVLRMTKCLLRESSGTSFDAILEMSCVMRVLAHQTPEHKAAVEAFFLRDRKR